MYYYCHIKHTLIIYSTRLCECRSITDSIQIKGFTWKSINNDSLNTPFNVSELEMLSDF